MAKLNKNDSLEVTLGILMNMILSIWKNEYHIF